MGELPQGHDARRLMVGADSRDITPREPTFLYGYPHVPRVSRGMHDPLLASAMFVGDGVNGAVFVSVDTIWLPKSLVAQTRARIARESGLPEGHLMITATHTHSGPVTVPMLSNTEDPVVSPPDPRYLSQLVDGIVSAALSAVRRAEPAEIAFALAECTAVGSNRIDPAGPTITEIPVVAARALVASSRLIGLMYVNPVHPTVLHADSTLISADFPGMCRAYLQANLVGRECPVLSHLGAAGNQSPRFVARSHTFSEAERIGNRLGRAIEAAAMAADFTSVLSVSCQATAVDLPPRPLPSLDAATKALCDARSRLAQLQRSTANYGLVRTAECAVFGAEETACLVRASAEGKLRSAQEGCLPAEIQLIRIGNWSFVCWPGEVFVEFAIQIRDRHPNAFVITLANGELQGYLVTAEAVQLGCYEASNAVFASPSSGNILVDATLALLARAGIESNAATSI